MCEHLWVKVYEGAGFYSRLITCVHCDELRVIPSYKEKDYLWPHEISTPTEE